MMRLVLIRHGDAGAYTLPDDMRNLSALGQAQVIQTAEFLRTYAIQPDMLITSPYNRAQQTLALICQHLHWQCSPVIYENITPNDDAVAAIKGLSVLIDEHALHDDAWVVVVCHMDIIAKMAALLTGEALQPFALAQACIYDLPCVALGAHAQQVSSFIPVVQA